MEWIRVVVWGAETPLNMYRTAPLFRHPQPPPKPPYKTGKFLCVDGVPTKRFEPPQSPMSMEKDIRKGLGLE